MGIIHDVVVGDLLGQRIMKKEENKEYEALFQKRHRCAHVMMPSMNVATSQPDHMQGLLVYI